MRNNRFFFEGSQFTMCSLVQWAIPCANREVEKMVEAHKGIELLLRCLLPVHQMYIIKY